MKRLPAITHDRFSLIRFRSPLLAESRLFSLPAGNEMFHFPAFPPHALCVQAWVTGHVSCRVSPFRNPWIEAWLAAPQGFSQPPTSFIGSWCQGIHRVPLITWPQRCSRPLCSSQDAGGPGALTAAYTRQRAVQRDVGPQAHTGPVDHDWSRAPGAPLKKHCSLRTQQRAWASPLARTRFPAPKSCTHDPHHEAGLLVSVPLREHHLGSIVREVALGRAPEGPLPDAP